MNKLLFRIQDWLADNTTFVQYPRQQLVSPAKPILFQKPKVPLAERLLIGGVSLAALIILIPLLIVMVIVFWAALSSAFS